MFSLSANAPTLFPSVTALPASVCAEVSAAARSRVDVGDLDELVRARCKLREQQSSSAADGGSRLLQQLAQVRQLTGESDPFIALSSVLREARQLRALRAQLLKLTAQPDGATALRAVENESRELGELRAFEATVCAALGCSDRRLVAGELEARSQLHERLCLFARVDHPASAGRAEGKENDGADTDAPPTPAAGAELQAVGAALTALQSRERERLGLLQLRNDLLAAASSESPRRASGESGGEASEARSREALALVRELLEVAELAKLETRAPTAAAALHALREMPTATRDQLGRARRRLRRLHALLSRSDRSLPLAVHGERPAEAPTAADAPPPAAGAAPEIASPPAVPATLATA